MRTRIQRSSLLVLLVLGTFAEVRAQEIRRIQPREQRPYPELVVDHVAHTPAPATEGQAIAIEIRVKNEGTAPSSGQEILHIGCANEQPGGPACPFGSDQRSLPVLYPASSSAGPSVHGVQLLTVPSWKTGSYELETWVEAPGQTPPGPVTATIVVTTAGETPTGPVIGRAIGEGIGANAGDDGVAQGAGGRGVPVSAAEAPDPAVRVVPEMAAGKPAEFAPAKPVGQVAPVGPPDLVATVKVWGGATLYPVAVIVRNEGLGFTPETTFRLSCNALVSGQVVGTCLSTIEKPVPPLAAGKGADISMPWAPPLHCDSNPDPPHVEMCEVEAVVDPGNLVVESDEANNTQIFHIPPQ